MECSNGFAAPMNSTEWNRVYAEYMQSPQGKIMNSDITLAGFKNIFWWEWIHRLWARLFAPVFLIPFLYFLFQKMIERKLMWKLIFVFILGGLQGALGWFMVSTGLKDVPWVSPYSLCAHLLLATILFAYLLWLALEQFFPKSELQNAIIDKSASIFSKVFSLSFSYSWDLEHLWQVELPLQQSGILHGLKSAAPGFRKMSLCFQIHYGIRY